MKMQANTTLFFYQNGKLTTVSEKGRARTIFRADDRPLAEQHTGDAGPPGLLATDDKGSVLTVQNDDEEEHHAYSAYGHDPSMRSGKRLIGFNGEHIEPSIEHYLLGNGYRGYDPRQLLRFLSPDSLSPFEAGGLNAYAYCENDPINNIDPSGHNILKGLKNILFNRKENKLNRINAHNEIVTKINNQLEKLEPNITQDKVNIPNLYRNKKRLDAMEKQPYTPLSEKDKAYAKKHGIDVSTISELGEKNGLETFDLAKTHKLYLAALDKPTPKNQAREVRNIRSTSASTKQKDWTSFFGRNHPNGRFNY